MKYLQENMTDSLGCMKATSDCKMGLTANMDLLVNKKHGKLDFAPVKNN